MALKVSHIDFVKNRKIYYIISCSLIAIAVIVSLIFGVKVDIQFRGGTIATYSYSGELNIDDFEKTVQDQTGMTSSTAMKLSSRDMRKMIKVAKTMAMS